MAENTPRRLEPQAPHGNRSRCHCHRNASAATARRPVRSTTVHSDHRVPDPYTATLILHERSRHVFQYPIPFSRSFPGFQSSERSKREDSPPHVHVIYVARYLFSVRASLVSQKFCQIHESQNGVAAHQNADTKSFCILLFSCQEFCIDISIE